MLMSFMVGAALALAPLWGGPEPSFQILILFIVGPSGLKVWQSIAAPAER